MSAREDKKSLESRLREMERSLRRAQEELNVKLSEVSGVCVDNFLCWTEFLTILFPLLL